MSAAYEQTRRLIVTWQHPQTRAISPVGFMVFDLSAYGSSAIRHALETEGFQPLLDFPICDVIDLPNLTAGSVTQPRASYTRSSPRVPHM